MIIRKIMMIYSERECREPARVESDPLSSAPVKKGAVLHDPYSNALCMLT